MSTMPNMALQSLDEAALFQYLGDAWYAQFKPEKGQSYYLGSSAEVGRLQFDILVPALRVELARPERPDVHDCVAAAIQRHGSWKMPADLVTAIAVARDMERSNRAGGAASVNLPGPGDTTRMTQQPFE